MANKIYTKNPPSHKATEGQVGKIYTKKGDKGKTKTFYGEMSKGDELAEALGSIDELNSWIGVILGQILNFKLPITNQLPKSKYQIFKLDVELKRIQGNLLTMGTILAGGNKRLSVLETKRLERLIDKLTAEMPALSNFIYPVGEMQVARAVCRRAERRIVNYFELSPHFAKASRGDTAIKKYLNRLSDAMFTMARWVNYKTDVKEEIWKG